MAEPDELDVDDIGDGTAGTLRHIADDRYALFDGAGARRGRCEDGTSIYRAPYRYVCIDGEWVRQEPAEI